MPRWELPGPFWTYATICLGGLTFLYLRLSETKGKTLEEIEMNVRKEDMRKENHAQASRGI